MSDSRDRLDEIQQFVERTEGKVYPRRVFLSMAAAMGLAPIAARLTPALADSAELVVVNWGGDAIKGMQRSWVDPYLKKFPDRKAVIDGTGPSTARIRTMVERHCFQYEGKSYPVSVSMGVSATGGDATLTPHELLRQADERLYQAKHGGRNRVVA